MSDGSTKWMSYDELAAAMGINRESARQLAIRKRWGRRKGNDGKARVGVPEDALRPDTGSITRPATGPSTSPAPSESTSDDTSPIRVLTRHIERLEQELVTAKEKAAERDTIAAQLDALRTVLEIERLRTDEWKSVADRFALQAEGLARRRPWWLPRLFVG
jgi:hypothetical protein